MRFFNTIILIITISIEIYSCKTEAKESDIHRIIKGNFSIEAYSCGCFGCGKEKMNVYEQNGKRWLKIIFNQTSDKLITKEIEFDHYTEHRLDSLLIDAVKKQKEGGCTTTSDWKVWNNSLKFNFKDGRCSVLDFFDLLILNTD